MSGSTSAENSGQVDLAGRVALITGANTGIGRVTAVELARCGATVVVTCRNAERAAPVLAEIAALPKARPARWLALDLADFGSVRECARQFLALDLPLHLLINNAGQAGVRGLTASGFEQAFGVNHMGHFLLTTLLLERLKASAPARVITLSSVAHKRVDGIPFERLRRPTRSRTGITEYSVSKLANLLFSAELGRQLAGSGVTTYAVHPGIVASDFWRSLPPPLVWLLRWARGMITAEQGARTTLHCATAPGLEAQSGLYWGECRVRSPSAVGQDQALAQRLWAQSLAWIA